MIGKEKHLFCMYHFLTLYLLNCMIGKEKHDPQGWQVYNTCRLDINVDFVEILANLIWS
jgi:hypothetical protein